MHRCCRSGAAGSRQPSDRRPKGLHQLRLPAIGPLILTPRWCRPSPQAGCRPLRRAAGPRLATACYGVHEDGLLDITTAGRSRLPRLDHQTRATRTSDACRLARHARFPKLPPGLSCSGWIRLGKRFGARNRRTRRGLRARAGAFGSTRRGPRVPKSAPLPLEYPGCRYRRSGGAAGRGSVRPSRRGLSGRRTRRGARR